ncbi:hypothetical protein D7Z54_05170 [Salibacterium salarium]|uniref:ComG operon protein 7 n=1 Tax=Salibacterium salarium TaxID=284579 RepID=A0A3R9P9T0_9BACI|nr:competence type IV pilus minor pilin ComGG [Salibacterium salarium]RSL34536.1 hypothetical protein D7Z54_05170 [Salibacterium salarium]
MGEKGAIMPVMLMVCFLFSALLLFQITVYINEKHNVTKEEEILTLEWLLRNAEQEWVKQIEVTGIDERTITLPSGTVRFELLSKNKNHVRVKIIAKDNNGKKRHHYLNMEGNNDTNE